MKNPLSFCLVAAVAGTLACSDDGTTDRGNQGGSGGGQVGAAGSSSAGNGGSGGVTGGAGSGNAGSGGGVSSVSRGPELTISPLDGTNVAIADTNGASTINGAAYLVQSMTAGGMITTQATLTGAGGKVCIAGSTVAVPMGANGDNYTEYWGAEIDFDLNRVAAEGGGGAVVDAGADAGDAGPAPLGTTAGPWTPGAVKGISFVVEGNNMALPGGGIPSAFRFKSRPFGSATSENFCTNLVPMSGGVNDVLFTDIRRDCWNSPTEAASLFQDPAAYTQLQNLGWQIPAAPMIALPFDFCVSKIAPIL